MNYKLFLECRDAYKNGQNVMDLVQKSVPNSRSLAIEIAYDLQAGTYIRDFYNNEEKKRMYTDEGGDILERHINKDSVILNVGAGELWTIALMVDRISVKPKMVYNLEISWSRIYKGCSFWNDIHGASIKMKPLVADMLEIPLPTKSVDIVTSSHALEANGSQLSEIVNELFRVSRDKCVLFEPCYELCSKEGRERMDRLGYIKDVENVVKNLGGSVENIIPITHSSNALNPTACFIIKVPPSYATYEGGSHFTVPGTDYLLEHKKDCYYSIDTGIAFPILKGIPILKSDSAILASKY
ncbi:methyltransferase domain-containing protein [Halomonas sp. ISL-60]|uniref:methyltransferase domain-containing protein n=1 Tax=Halomonas sp. ISL-56 TaxID=2819149 RepID=UPI001BEA2A50|nr:methyltransferase domain-containing protein [Halomonas sp. ISL-56]MBT2772446.1 methyltransferase domain-containing protein [Halomonas sp. ISL-60]MBT2803373.1 methyltransferase domain-containing protein [Halomonas sp. ISL-56]